MRNLFVITGLIISVILSSVYAQLPFYPDNTQSPNAASLGEYGRFDMSYYTGQPNINIPLYEFPVGDNKFPVSMSYNVSDIKPDHKSSWTGVGWSLNCGGIITRIQHGQTDEYKQRSNNKYCELGYYYPTMSLDTVAWNTNEFLENTLTLLLRENIRDYDVEPDVYVFNFCGYTGEFFLDAKKNWVVRSRDAISVDKSLELIEPPVPRIPQGTGSEYSQVRSGFTLRDSNGTVYRFGYDENSIELSLPFFNQNYGEWTASGWYLTEINYPDGNTVKLNYIRGSYTNQMWQCGYMYQKTDDIYGHFYHANITYQRNAIFNNLMGTLIWPSFLQSIEFPLGKIIIKSSDRKHCEYNIDTYLNNLDPWEYKNKFNVIMDKVSPDNKAEAANVFENRLNSKRVERITVVSKSNDTIRYVNFGYARRSSRYFLTSLRINGIQRYSFKYYNPDSLPLPATNLTDHWGYYNGIVSKISQPYSYYDSKEPDSTRTKYGVLEQIIYPTGGRTVFEYEANDCRSVALTNSCKCNHLPDNILVGGVRIKKITNYDDDIRLNSKSYYYVKNYVRKQSSPESSGVLMGEPRYSFVAYSLKTLDGFRSKLSVFCCGTSFHSNGTLVNEPHIGYSEVTEVLDDGSFSVYKFSDYKKFPDEPIEAFFLGDNQPYHTVVSSRQMDRGNLIEKTDYSSDLKPIRRRSIEYTHNGEFVPAINMKRFTEFDASEAIEAVAYKRYYYTPLISRDTIMEYLPNGNYCTITEYSYNKYNQISSAKEYVPGTDYFNQKSYRYLWQDSYDAERLHIIAPVTKHEINGNCKQWAANDKPNTEMVYNKIPGTVLYTPTHIRHSAWGVNIESDTTYCMYDTHGKLIYRETNGGKGIVYLWGHSRHHIIAKIENVSYLDVRRVIGLPDKFNNLETPDYAALAKLREALPLAQVTTYRYKPLVGVTSITGPDGTTEYYEYDRLGRLTAVFDNEGNIVKSYQYNFKNRYQ